MITPRRSRILNRRGNHYNRSRDGCFIKLAMLVFMVVVIMLLVMCQP